MKDSEDLRAVRDACLRRTIELCASAHPFYSRRFRECGITPADIRTLDDIERLPLVHKHDYMASPEDFRLQANELPQLSFEERTLWNIAYTTGTTSGKPSPFFNTTHDQFEIMIQARVCAEVEGFRPDDILANLIPLSSLPTGGFLVVGRTAEIIGIPVVSALTGAKQPQYPVRRSLDESIDCIATANASVFWGIPSFVRRFFRRARERNVQFPRARMAVLSGEPVTSSLVDELFEHLAAFGASDPQVRNRYSCTEMQGGLVQCCNGADLQNIVPELYVIEAVDPDTGKRVPEGEEGVMALTHLHRTGTVLLRYLVGDTIALRNDACPHCGRIGERMVSLPHRSDDLVKVKGMLVNPALVFDALAADRAIREFQLVVRKSNPADRDSMDVLVVRVEAEADARDRLAAQLPELVQRIIMVRPEIEFAAPGEIHDPLKNLKARRFVDERSR